MTINNTSSTEENGPHPRAIEGAVIPVDQSSAAVLTVDQGSTAAATPTEQSFASQESIANSGKDSSLEFGQENQANICVLQQRDAIQVCPTTPEKAQKRRRNYLDTIPNLDVVKDMDVCEPSDGEVPDVGTLTIPRNLKLFTLLGIVDESYCVFCLFVPILHACQFCFQDML